MKKLFITLGFLMITTLIFSIIGFYQLEVNLEDEIGLFFISLSMVPVFITFGIIIGFLLEDK